ncbi:MAG: sigma-70 family RNA polymerase sigma factor [Ruminococcus sp.]|nr:sigma-70 family RNA polymerase sigma factor [Ruminococcus sp.]
MEDKEIIELYLMRSESAINETADKYGAYCHTIAYNILQNNSDTEEAVSDTYMSAWNSIPPHIPHCFRAFIGSIARNISLKKYRFLNTQMRGEGQVSLALEELSECISSSKTVESEVDNTELANHLNKFLSDLKGLDRKIFVKRYWYLYSVSDIAKDMGFSESKVKSNLHRTRKKLRIYLEKEGVNIEC